jgi:hypothetical protein
MVSSVSVRVDRKSTYTYMATVRRFGVPSSFGGFEGAVAVGGLRCGDPVGGSCAKTSPLAGTLPTAVLGPRGSGAVRPTCWRPCARPWSLRLFVGVPAADGREHEKRPRHWRSSSLRRPLVGSPRRSARYGVRPEKAKARSKKNWRTRRMPARARTTEREVPMSLKLALAGILLVPEFFLLGPSPFPVARRRRAERPGEPARGRRSEELLQWRGLFFRSRPSAAGMPGKSRSDHGRAQGRQQVGRNRTDPHGPSTAVGSVPANGEVFAQPPPTGSPAAEPAHSHAPSKGRETCASTPGQQSSWPRSAER